MPKVTFRGVVGRGEEKKYRRMRLSDIVLDRNPGTGDFDLPTVALVNNAPVLRADWRKTIPGRNDSVEFVTLPMGGGGGGSNPLKIVLTVVLAVVAAYTGGAAAGAIGAIWGTAAGSVVGGLVTGAVMMLGNMLLGSIISTPSLPSGQAGAANAQQADPTYSLGAQNNISRLGQVIPNLFGRMKFIPDRASVPYYKYVGNEQYLFQVFVLTEGLIDVEQMFFGETEFWSKDGGVSSSYDVAVQFTSPGEAVTLFPDNVDVSVEVAGQRLFAPNEEGYDGPLVFNANSPGVQTDRLAFNFIFPNGLIAYDKYGDKAQVDVNYSIRYQQIDDFDNALSAWAVLSTGTFSAATNTAQRFTVEKAVPLARYRVEVGRTNEIPDNGRFVHVMQWESLYSYIPGTIIYNQSMVALKIRATNILSQNAASSFSVLGTRILPEWNAASQAWDAAAPTRNLAAAIAFIARWQHGARLPDNQIDLDTLQQYGDDLLAKGYEFNAYVSGAYMVWGLLCELLAPYGVVPRIVGGARGGILSFSREGANRPVRHIFTPENIVKGSLKTVWHTPSSDSPDAVSVSYIDAALGYEQREVLATLGNPNPQNIASKSLLGITDRQAAYEAATKMALENQFRRVEYTFQIEMVGRLLAVNDVISISHPMVGESISGHIAGFDQAARTVDLGGDIDTGTDTATYLWFDLKDGRPFGPVAIETMTGGAATLSLKSLEAAMALAGIDPFEMMESSHNGAAFPTVWTLETEKISVKRAIITGLSVIDSHIFEVTAINDNSAVYDYQPGAAPPPRGRPSGDSAASLAAPASLTITVSGSKASPTLIVSWPPVPGATSYGVAIAFPGGLPVNQPSVTINATQIAVPQGSVIVSVWGANEIGAGPQISKTVSTDDLFLAQPAPYLVTPYLGGALSVAWPAIEGADFIDIQVASTAGTVISETSLTGGATGFSLSAADQTGGPQRSLNVTVVAGVTGGITAAGNLAVNDDVPPSPSAYDSTVTDTAITLTSITVDDADVTGYVVARGAAADFGIDDVAEIRTISGLPYTWDGLTAGTEYYFKIAAKDAFYDLSPEPMMLNYSGTATITTTGG